MSQKRRDLDVIAYHSACEDRLLRPLSAKLLPPTLPERNGWVDRNQLYAFVGRSRRPLIALARHLGIDEIPAPSTGCALTETRFAKKVHDLVQLDAGAGRWDYELLKTGRHFRHSTDVKVIVGRNQSDNGTLEFMHEQPGARSSALLRPRGFEGPCVLVIGPATAEAMEFAIGLVVRYTKNRAALGQQIEVNESGQTHLVPGRACDIADEAATLAT
jgi:hypothetical protein